MEQIIEILVGALAQVLVIVIGAVAGFAGMKVKNFYNQKEIKETIENN
jgi:type IV secretory pathway VirB2 component (pilin)